MTHILHIKRTYAFLNADKMSIQFQILTLILSFFIPNMCEIIIIKGIRDKITISIGLLFLSSCFNRLNIIVVLIIPEMAERHDAKVMLRIARDLVLQLQMLIDNK